MRKYSFLILVILLSIFVAPSVVSAAQVPFNIITSPTDDFQPSKDYSITFASEVTINAETTKGAKVNLTVSYDDSLELKPKVYDEVTVGATCKYIQPIELKLGSNYIDIRVSKEGLETRKVVHIIKRKDGAVMKSLQNMIVIPDGK